MHRFLAEVDSCELLDTFSVIPGLHCYWRRRRKGPFHRPSDFLSSASVPSHQARKVISTLTETREGAPDQLTDFRFPPHFPFSQYFALLFSSPYSFRYPQVLPILPAFVVSTLTQFRFLLPAVRSNFALLSRLDLCFLPRSPFSFLL